MSGSVGETRRSTRFGIDRSVRRSGPGGRSLLGGSPVRLFRLTPTGASLFDQVVAGRTIAPSPAAEALIDRWIDAGLLHPDPPRCSGPFGPDQVTVVIPVRDRPNGLRLLLDSIADATQVPVAVVVVDDGSADPTQVSRVVTEFVRDGGRELSVRVVRRARSGGPAVARNDGAALVQTALVAFLDSDCRVDPDWLDPLLAQFSDPTVAIAAPRVCAGAAHSALARYDRSRSPLDMGSEPARVAPGTRVPYVPSAALLCRCDVFAGVAGFDTGLAVGEDVDLIWRVVAAGRRVRFVPESSVSHAVRPTIGTWVRQRFAYGTSAAALEARHPGEVAPLVVSRWSAAVWALVAVGRPGLGASLAVGTTAQLARKLPDVSRRDSIRLGLGGHLGAGRQLARTVLRVWWPVALPAAVVSRRARRVVAVCGAWTAIEAWWTQRSAAERASCDDLAEWSPLDPCRFVSLTLLDDMAYGAGVWVGCARSRSWGALRPALSSPRS